MGYPGRLKTREGFKVGFYGIDQGRGEIDMKIIKIYRINHTTLKFELIALTGTIKNTCCTLSNIFLSYVVNLIMLFQLI